MNKKTVVLITGHYYESKRKAGFHWIAEEYYKMGWEVIFITAPISYLSKLRNDHKFTYDIENEKNSLKKVKGDLYSYVYFTLYHPGNLRSKVLNNLMTPLFSLYGKSLKGDLGNIIKKADLFIFESTPGLILFDKFKRINPTAKYVYRVSDDLKLIKAHPMVIKYESKHYQDFDLISVPSEFIYNQFREKDNVRLHFHGIEKSFFDSEKKSPFEKGKKNAVFVGNSHFDYKFLEMAAKNFSEINFHIIGPLEKKIVKENIIYYGEMPFKDTIKYIINADIGLANRSYFYGAESLTDSLKILQYTYCNLPYIAPEFLRSNRENGFFYSPDDDNSIRKAINDSLSYKGNNQQSVASWLDLVTNINKTLFCP